MYPRQAIERRWVWLMLERMNEENKTWLKRKKYFCCCVEQGMQWRPRARKRTTTTQQW